MLLHRDHLRVLSAYAEDLKMTLRTKRAATLALLILPALASFAAAQPAMDADTDSTSIPAGGRYSMSPVDGGIMRLDKETGVVAICARIGDEIACRGIEDKTGGPKADELSALKAENEQLKRRINAMMAAIDSNEKMLMAPYGYGMREYGPQGGPPSGRFEMPSEEDVDHALDYMTRVYKKIRDRVSDLDKPSPPGKPETAPATPPIGPGSPPPAPPPKATP
jgi:hypothetical protein